MDQGIGIMGFDHALTIHRSISGARVTMVADLDATQPALIRACVAASKPVLGEKPLSQAGSAALPIDLGDRAAVVGDAGPRHSRARFAEGYRLETQEWVDTLTGAPPGVLASAGVSSMCAGGGRQPVAVPAW